MNKKRKQGQCLVEFCVLLQVVLIETLLFSILTLHTLVPILIKIDLYEMARVHLYGNQKEHCRMSQHWPSQIFKTELFCYESGEYMARIEIKFGKQKLMSFEEHLSLKGPFL
jgi:hypothetical protein